MHVVDPLGVVVGADAVLGDEQRHASRPCAPTRSAGGLEALRPVLVAHVQHGHALLGAEHAVAARCACASRSARRGSRRPRWRRGRRPPSRRYMRAVRSSPPSTGHVLGHRQRQADRARPGPPARMASTALRWASTNTSLTRRRRSRVGLARREDAEQPADRGDDVRLVDRAGPGHRRRPARRQRARRRRRSGRRSPGPPSRPRSATQRGVVKWWKVTIGSMPCARSAVALAAVVVDGGGRPLALLGLDPAPLDREPVASRDRSRRPGPRPRRPPVPRVAGVARRLGAADCPRCAPTPTSRCSSCRPRSGGRRWPCPRGSRRGSGGRRWCRRSRLRTYRQRTPPATVSARAPGRRRRPRRAARPRAHRGQHLPRRHRPTRTASASSAARSRGRRWWPRPARSTPTGTSTRCTPTSCGPGDPPVPILYEVDRIRDGRSFTTRRVVAIQHGKAIFNMSASFQVHEEASTTQVADARRRRRPRTLPDVARAVRRRAATEIGAVDTTGPGPIDIRHVDWRRRATARSRCRRASECGCGPTARCPTTRSCTRACSPTRRT